MEVERDVNNELYLNAQKRVKELKGFYGHLATYVIVNSFISIVIILGLLRFFLFLLIFDFTEELTPFFMDISDGCQSCLHFPVL